MTQIDIAVNIFNFLYLTWQISWCSINFIHFTMEVIISTHFYATSVYRCTIQFQVLFIK